MDAYVDIYISLLTYLLLYIHLTHVGELCCYVCGSEEGVGGVKLMKCSRCLQVRYCSKEHQKEHWKVPFLNLDCSDFLL